MMVNRIFDLREVSGWVVWGFNMYVNEVLYDPVPKRVQDNTMPYWKALSSGKYQLRGIS